MENLTFESFFTNSAHPVQAMCHGAAPQPLTHFKVQDKVDLRARGHSQRRVAIKERERSVKHRRVISLGMCTSPECGTYPTPELQHTGSIKERQNQEQQKHKSTVLGRNPMRFTRQLVNKNQQIRRKF